MRPLNDDASIAFLRGIRTRLRPFAGSFTLHELTSRPWASVTFSGARHRICFTLEGDGAGAAADEFLGSMAEAEFALRGHILADISLAEEQREAPDRVRISLEALTVKDD
jgi:hypothetical protein